jgi:ATP-binding cassette subfamily C protein CydC
MSLGILVLLPLSAFEAGAALPGAAVTLTRARIAARRVVDLLDRADRPVPHGTRPVAEPCHLRGPADGTPGPSRSTCHPARASPSSGAAAAARPAH